MRSHRSSKLPNKEDKSRESLKPGGRKGVVNCKWFTMPRTGHVEDESVITSPDKSGIHSYQVGWLEGVQGRGEG